MSGGGVGRDESARGDCNLRVVNTHFWRPQTHTKHGGPGPTNHRLRGLPITGSGAYQSQGQGPTNHRIRGLPITGSGAYQSQAQGPTNRRLRGLPIAGSGAYQSQARGPTNHRLRNLPITLFCSAQFQVKDSI